MCINICSQTLKNVSATYSVSKSFLSPIYFQLTTTAECLMSDLEVHKKLNSRHVVQEMETIAYRKPSSISLVLLFRLILQQHRPVNSCMCNGDGDDGQTFNRLNHQKWWSFVEKSLSEAANVLDAHYVTWETDELNLTIWTGWSGWIDTTGTRCVTLTAWMVLHCPHCFRFSFFKWKRPRGRRQHAPLVSYMPTAGLIALLGEHTYNNMHFH